MEVKGKIIVVLPPQSGTSQAGNAWKKQEYVLETFDAYPRKVHFDFFGDRADQYPLALGDVVNLSFDIESRAYNGRGYTSNSGWRAEKIDPNAAAAPQQPMPAAPAAAPSYAAPAQPVPDFTQSSKNDDLPF